MTIAASAVIAPSASLAPSAVIAPDAAISLRPSSAGYSHAFGVRFLGDTNNGLGQRMDTGATLNGETSAVISAYFTVENVQPSIVACQWSGSWILALTREGEYGTGTHGTRWWFQGPGNPVAWEWAYTLQVGDVVHTVGVVDLSQALEVDMVDVYASVNGGPFAQVTLTRHEDFGGASMPTAYPAAMVDIIAGGGTYGTAQALNGPVIDLAIWRGSDGALPDPTDLHDATIGGPADFTGMGAYGWWRFGDDPSDASPTIVDLGAGGNDGTLTTGGEPAGLPQIIEI